MIKAHIILTILLVSSISTGAEVTLPNSSLVVIKAVEPIGPKSVIAGQEVILVVGYPVEVKGNVLIKAGTPAIGFVDESKGSQMAGVSGKIAISIRSTTAVDGTTIPLSGRMLNTGDSEVGSTVAVGAILCPLALLNKGKEGVIPSGAEVRTMTVGSYLINTDNLANIESIPVPKTPTPTASSSMTTDPTDF